MNIDKLPRPINDKVLIQVCDAEDEVTQGGIIIPGTAKEKPRVGIVIATGDGGNERPMSVRVGDKVYYGRYAATNGVDMELEGVRYIIISESDVYAVV
jgi:chaperonin GroES